VLPRAAMPAGVLASTSELATGAQSFSASWDGASGPAPSRAGNPRTAGRLAGTRAAALCPSQLLRAGRSAALLLRSCACCIMLLWRVYYYSTGKRG
jgi:hypothetical protein